MVNPSLRPPRRWIPRRLQPGRLLRQWALRQVEDGQVVSGVFAGMKYTPHARSERAYLARMLGTYEMELATAVQDLIQRTPDQILNIGAAEGYYAVGLALRCPQAVVSAFEIRDHTALKDMIRLNQVSDRVHVHGLCDLPALNAHLQTAAAPAVVIDVEGAERQLLDPDAAPKLRSALILVELHDFLDPTIGDTIHARFAATHAVQEIHARPRTAADFPLSLGILQPLVPKRYISALMFEHRPAGMRWFYMTPKSTPGTQ